MAVLVCFVGAGGRRVYKTHKNWHMLGDFSLYIQPGVEKLAQCVKMATGITG
jgi:hypothetical protein